MLRQKHVGFRNEAAYGLIASTIGFVFVSVGGAGLISSLAKNILGRARPKLFETGGPLDFHLFAFDPDYASFPSGHATNIFAFATVIGILWPRARVLLYIAAAWIAATRPLIGQHYFTDAVAGAILGTVFPFIVRERFAARRWLFERAPDGSYQIAGLTHPALARLAQLSRGFGGRAAIAPERWQSLERMPIYRVNSALHICLEPAIGSGSSSRSAWTADLPKR